MINRVRNLLAASRRLFRVDQSLLGRIKLLIALLLTAAAISASTGWSPLMRAHPGMLLQGTVAGVALWVLLTALRLFGVRFIASYRTEFTARSELLRGTPWLTALGNAVVASCGVELVARGMLFGLVALGPGSREGASVRIIAAFLLNAVVTVAPLLVSSPPKRIRISHPRHWLNQFSIELLLGSALAALYYRTNSLAFVLCARAAVELADTLLLKSNRAIKVLTGTIKRT